MNNAHVSVGAEMEGDVVKIQNSGAWLDQDLVFDLKTRSIKKLKNVYQFQDMVDGELQRLWVSRVVTFILAFHNHGLFNHIRIMGVKYQINTWESTNNNALAKLVALVHHVIALAQVHPVGKIETCRSDLDVLEIRRQLLGASDALSPETNNRWIGNRAGVGLSENEWD